MLYGRNTIAKSRITHSANCAEPFTARPSDHCIAFSDEYCKKEAENISIIEKPYLMAYSGA
jgi:hypothetical protein